MRDARRAVGSAYPIVEINSLAFRHHVRTLDRFVEMAAERGVDQVNLTPLHDHVQVIPALEAQYRDEIRRSKLFRVVTADVYVSDLLHQAGLSGGATKLYLSFDNSLLATSEAGTVAYIKKKQNGHCAPDPAATEILPLFGVAHVDLARSNLTRL